MNKKLKKFLESRIFLALCAGTYSLLVGFLYHDVSTIFSEVQGFTYTASQLGLIVFSCALAILPVTYLPIRSSRVSSSILWVLYYSFYVPAIALPQHIVHLDVFDIVMWMMLIAVGFLITAVGHYLPVRRLRRPDLGSRGYFIFLMSACFLFIFVTFINFGMDLKFSGLDDVYGQRAVYKDELAASGSSIAGYVVILSGYWLAPVMLLSGLYFNKMKLRYGWWLIGFGIFLSAYIYSVAAFKSIALSFVLVLAYAQLMKMRGGIGAKVSFAIISTVFLSWTLSAVPGLDFISHHLVRRVFLVPGMNASYFFEYFTRWPGYAQQAPPQAVSLYYYGTNGSANAGFLASGYASLGVAGVILAAIFAAALLWITNIVTRGLPYVLVAAGFFMQSYALSNSALGTTMISYGFVFAILTFYICPFRENQFSEGI